MPKLATKQQLTPAEALRLVATLKFEPFNQAMRHAYAGCEDPNPMYCELDHAVIIIDGTTLLVDYTTFYDSYSHASMFEMGLIQHDGV